MRVLCGAQILGGLGVGAHLAAGALLAVQISGSESVAGLASTSTVLGAALAAVPLASLTSDRGRRYGLSAGLLSGFAGAVIVVIGAWQASVLAVLLGTTLTGAAAASGLQARYAATDLASPERSARALSIVVWATTVGSVLGPNLTGPGAVIARALDIPELAGSYVIAAAAFLAAAGVIWVRLRPDPLLLARSQDPSATPVVAGPHMRHRAREAWAVVRVRLDARLGLTAVALGHAAMVGVMVMTPVHMAHADVSITVIGLVISVHILGMYALSPIVGWASDRFGRHAVLIAGALILLAAAAVTGSADADHSISMGAGLFLLGLGWSCCLVAGSTLLSESVPAASRQDVQGLSDLTMNLSGALGGLVAGGVFAALSYGWLTLLAGVIVLPLAVRAGSARRSAVRA